MLIFLKWFHRNSSFELYIKLRRERKRDEKFEFLIQLLRWIYNYYYNLLKSDNLKKRKYLHGEKIV